MNVAAPRTDYPAIEALVPHRGDMLLVDRVVECDDHRVRAVYTVREAAWYLDSGAMPAWLGIELMAQAIAAYSGFTKRARGLPPVQGYLLGSRKYRCAIPAFPVGAALHIVAERQYQEASGIGAFDCFIELKGARIADATLTVFEPA